MARNEVTRREVLEPIKGTPDQVANVLHAYERRGELLSSDRELRDNWTRTQRLRGTSVISDEVLVYARLLMPVPPESAAPVRKSGVGPALLRAGIFVGVCLISASLVILGIIALATWALDTLRLTGASLLGAIFAGFVAWLLLSVRRGHACRGLHCPGCTG